VEVKKVIVVATLGFSCLFMGIEPDDTLTTNDVFLQQLLHHKTAVASRQPWRPIHEDTRDTVVQIFSQVAEIDMLQPYKTPTQYGVRGTGFFIDNQGHIITNAHVIDQAIAIWIRIPSLGKHLIDVHLIGVCPERDIALLKVAPKELQVIKTEIGIIPYLVLGDSDKVRRADEVLALGYPLGQESLKSTTGVISGREGTMIQMSAPINPGSSGGPLLNIKGEVIGINSSGVSDAQNVGYIIPINDLHAIYHDLQTSPFLRKPFSGIVYQNANNQLTSFLANPQPGGCCVVEIIKDSPAYKAGMERLDMIYEINGYEVDIYGDMKVSWSEDKLSLSNYIWRLAVGDKIDIVMYRKGERKHCTLRLDQSEPLPIRRIHPGHEPIDYELFGGMVIMQLSLNHVKLMLASAPGLIKYTEMKHQTLPALIITHIFPNSQLFRSRTLAPGFILHEVNGHPVATLTELRNVLRDKVHEKYLTLKAIDTASKASDNIFVVLAMKELLEEVQQLAPLFHYPLTTTVQELLASAHQE
jgi:serine protease Do